MSQYRQTAEQLLKQSVSPDANFRPGQWEAIEALVEHRRRTLVVQRTGWGKSVVYFLATALLRQGGAGPTLLISPLLSLMRNQIQSAEKMGIRAETINSTNQDRWEQIEHDLLAGHIDLLLISPERLANSRFQKNVWPRLHQQIGLVVVDEAHCISDWGHDFRPNYRRITPLLNQLPSDTPILGTTATANNRVIADVDEILGPGLHIERGPLTRESLRLYVYPDPMPQATRFVLLDYLLNQIEGHGIIYCATRHDCRRVADWLQSKGHNVRAYYSGVEKDTGEDREALEQALLNNDLRALVASVALGMGFDKPDLSFIIHYQYPGSIISYYQQIGRAGRGIDRAHIILMVGQEDADIQQYFIDTAFPEPEQVEAAVQAMKEQGGLTRYQLEQQVNARRGVLGKILTHLELEEIIVKEGSEYKLKGGNFSPDYARWNQVTRQRQDELAQMQSYIRHDGCLMRYISEMLEDPTAPKACGRCKNCLKQESRFAPTPQQIEEARRFLRGVEIMTFDPRKQWPYGLTIPLKGRLDAPNQLGVALSTYNDEGYGRLVRQTKTNGGEFPTELLDASVALLQRYFAQNGEALEWVTSVPSLRYPNLVPRFAAELAARLGLPFHSVIEKPEERPPQKQMKNSAQQVSNIWDAYQINNSIPDAAVLLVDDIVDSGWTLTIVGQLLRKHGSGSVTPFVLSSFRY